jgi:periplasmic divalent cation tolerance protein
MWPSREKAGSAGLQQTERRFMDNTGHIVVFITASNEAEAHRIRDVVLQARQAACVNILSGISSSYWWHRRVESAEEHLLIVKTTASRLDTLIDLAKQNHSYKVPEIIAMPIVGGNPDYLAWIDKEVCAE